MAAGLAGHFHRVRGPLRRHRNVWDNDPNGSVVSGKMEMHLSRNLGLLGIEPPSQSTASKRDLPAQGGNPATGSPDLEPAGYDIAQGVSVDANEGRIWDVQVPGLLANRYLDRCCSPPMRALIDVTATLPA